jgi:hypothetical protein
MNSSVAFAMRNLSLILCLVRDSWNFCLNLFSTMKKEGKKTPSLAMNAHDRRPFPRGLSVQRPGNVF